MSRLECLIARFGFARVYYAVHNAYFVRSMFELTAPGRIAEVFELYKGLDAV